MRNAIIQYRCTVHAVPYNKDKDYSPVIRTVVISFVFVDLVFVVISTVQQGQRFSPVILRTYWGNFLCFRRSPVCCIRSGSFNPWPTLYVQYNNSVRLLRLFSCTSKIIINRTVQLAKDKEADALARITPLARVASKDLYRTIGLAPLFIPITIYAVGSCMDQHIVNWNEQVTECRQWCLQQQQEIARTKNTPTMQLTQDMAMKCSACSNRSSCQTLSGSPPLFLYRLVVILFDIVSSSSFL